MAERQLNVSISCPFCASSVSYISGNYVCKCKSCGRYIRIVLTGGIFSYSWKSEKLDLVKIGKKSIKEIIKGKNYKIIDDDNLYLPIWRAEGRIVGWVSGKKKIKRIAYTVSSGEGQTQTLYRTEGGERVKRIMDTPTFLYYVDNNFFREFFPSMDLVELEKIKSLRLFDEDKMKKFGKIYFPEKSADIALELFSSRLKKQTDDLYLEGQFEYLYKNFGVVSYRLCLIFLPIKLIRFATTNSEGLVIIDAVSGKSIGRRITDTGKKIKRSKLNKYLSRSALMLGTFFSSLLLVKGSIFTLFGLIILAGIVILMFKEFEKE